MATIGLLGCGWLGRPLADALSHSGYFVNVSSPTSRVFSKSLSAYVIDLPTRIDPDFFNCNSLIITLPFKRSLPDPTHYLKMIMAIKPYLSTAIKHLIFTSSTMIYQANNGPVTEESPLDDTERVQVLSQVEQFLLLLPDIKTTILRLGGLYGPDREIGQFALKKKVILKNHPVNLIHQSDVITIISQLITAPYHGILNAVSDTHPTRYTLYQQALNETELSKIKFIEDATTPYKIVDNTKLKRLLHFKFRHQL